MPRVPHDEDSHEEDVHGKRSVAQRIFTPGSFALLVVMVVIGLLVVPRPQIPSVGPRDAGYSQELFKQLPLVVVFEQTGIEEICSLNHDLGRRCFRPERVRLQRVAAGERAAWSASDMIFVERAYVEDRDFVGYEQAVFHLDTPHGDRGEYRVHRTTRLKSEYQYLPRCPDAH